MNLEIQSLRRAEAATLRLRGLYESYGYRKYRMGRFEEYSLYAANKSFLLGENVPTFTDLDGRLMALKPDVTLSIAKNTKADKNTCEKVYYLESVYRESKESHTYKEISQMGLECMGGVDDCVIAEVLALALKSLADFETDYVLKISNMDFVVGLMEELPVNADQKDIILGLIRTKNRSGSGTAGGRYREIDEGFRAVRRVWAGAGRGRCDRGYAENEGGGCPVIPPV